MLSVLADSLRVTGLLILRIGVDAHSLEGLRTGARGRYLLSIVKEWAEMDTGDDQFFLYFQKNIPSWDFLRHEKFVKKILKGPLGISGFTLYYNVFLPRAAGRDKVDACFFPFYMLPYFYRRGNAVVAIHDLAFVAHPEWFSWKHRIPLQFLARKASKKAKYVIVPSEFSKNEVLSRFHMAPGRVKVTYLAPDAIFSPEKDLDAINRVKAKFGLKKRYFLGVGTVFTRRHVEKVISAFSAIGGGDWQFFIAGRDLTNPPLHIDLLVSEINRRAGREMVIRRDFVEDNDLVFLYSGADFCVYLSTYEGFGIPPLEAMASGSIVLTTNYTALRESVNGAGCIIKDPTNIQEIRNALEGLMTNEELRNDLRKKGNEWVKQFSWRKTAEETLEILKN